MLRNWFFIVVIILVLAVVSVVQLPSKAYAQSEGQYWAVIVDVVDYQYLEDRTGFADGADLYQQLQPIFGSDHIRLLTNADATKANLRGTILDWLDQRDNMGDAVLFFFSGHGSTEYICPYDSLPTSYDNDIRSTELAQWLDNLESTNIVVILSSCHAGSFINEFSKSGRVVLTSCAENEDSWRSSSFGHTVFAHFVIEAFSQLGTIDVNRNHEVSAEEFFGYVEPRVVDWATKYGKTQHPQIGDADSGELTLVTTATITFHTNPAIAPIIIDGQTYGPGQLPVSFTWATGTVHTFAALSSQIEDPQKEGTRYLFSSWGGGDNSSERKIIVSESETYMANYKAQYRLTVVSDYAETGGGGWYDANSEVVYSLSSDVIDHGDGSRHRFIGWDLGETNTSGRIIMDSPKVVTAKWQIQPISQPAPNPRNWQTAYTVYIVIAVIAAVLALLSPLLIGKRRNKPAMVVSPVARAKLVLPGNSEISLAEAVKLIGRSDFDGVMSPGALRYISRQHLLIRSEQGKYFVEDYNSANGTKTNGIDIKGRGRWELRDGDRIDIAGMVALTFRVCNLPQKL